MFGGTGTGLAATSYLSEDADMLGAEAAYAELEADLQHELDNYEACTPGYDEYRYDLDDIGHDPYVLTSILSALHGGAYTLDEVQGDLDRLFGLQYTLTQTLETEIPLPHPKRGRSARAIPTPWKCRTPTTSVT